MLRSCAACGRIHDSRETCAARRRLPLPKKEQQAFRSTDAWTRKSLAVRQRDLGLCRVCLEEGVLTWKELSVHHIVPLTEDFDRRLDEDNLITLCSRHHRMAERGELPRQQLAALAGSPPAL